MFFRVQPSGLITNLIPPNDFAGPNYPRNQLFSEKYCIFRKSTLSSRILKIDDFHQKLRPLEDRPFFALVPLNLLSDAPTSPYAYKITIKRQHF